MSAIEPFELRIPQAELDDLRDRLAHTRFPERETVGDWGQGLPLAQARELCRYWSKDYDWRRCEAMLNGFGQYKTTIDGLGIHFLHLRSPEPNALPMVLTHGWPGSVIEFHKVMGPLTNPAAYGGDPKDAFHVVAPSLPGYGFSDRPTQKGWHVDKIAAAWVELMKRLGYQRFVAQGGDWGAVVTSALGRTGAPELAAIHLNMVVAFPSGPDLENLTDQEKEILADLQRYQTERSGYATQQGTRPQTLGYGLSDSPMGQAAWIYEKFWDWTDSNGDPRNVLSMDEMLDNIMLYWLPATGASSGRLYWEAMQGGMRMEPITIPACVSMFPKEVLRASRRWAEKGMTDIRYWNELDKGGHFAAFEQPDMFVAEIRNAFRQFR